MRSCNEPLSDRRGPKEHKTTQNNSGGVFQLKPSREHHRTHTGNRDYRDASRDRALNCSYEPMDGGENCRGRIIGAHIAVYPRNASPTLQTSQARGLQIATKMG